MPKYLLEVNYTIPGLKGVLAQGGTARRQAAAEAVAGAGGTIEAFYYAFGKHDVYVIADFPDNVSAAAVAMTVSAAGGATTRTTVLLAPEEIDAAAEKEISYQPPG